MTVNESLIVCRILKQHGYGDYEMTAEYGYTSMTCYPDFVYEHDKTIDMEGCKDASGNWDSARKFHKLCNEIEDALKKAADGNRARWIDKDGLYECSSCGAECGVMSKFCSECGEEMN